MWTIIPLICFLIVLFLLFGICTDSKKRDAAALREFELNLHMKHLDKVNRGVGRK